MGTRIVSVRSQQDLAKALLRVGFTRKHLAQLLADSGLGDLIYKIPKADDDETEVRGGVRFLAERRLLTTRFLDALEVERPELADVLARLRIDMELTEATKPLLDAATLDAIKAAARKGGLHRGVHQSRLKIRLPSELLASAATSLGDEPEQLDAWIDAANRQRVEVGDQLWMLQLLEPATEEADEPGKGELRDQLNRLRLIVPGALRSEELTNADRGSLQRIVQKFGIMLDTASFLDAVSSGLARCCLVRVAGNPTGTGFLVADDLVLTAYHVLWPAMDHADPSQVEFVFDCRRMGDAGRAVSLDVVTPTVAGDRSWLIDASQPTDNEWKNKPEPIGSETTPERLDFALVRLCEPWGAGPGFDIARRGHFDISAKGPAYEFAKDTPLMIFGHPMRDVGGQKTAYPQVFSIAPDAVIGTNPNHTRVHYRTNTRSGSSGSPVLTVDGRVVALHHYGVEGQYNQGIPVSAIVARPKVAAALGGEG